MTVTNLDIAKPFFPVKFVEDEAEYRITDRVIVLNLGAEPVQVEDQQLRPLNSVILARTTVRNIERIVVVEEFDSHDSDDALYARVKEVWPSAYDVRKEERLRGVSHYMGQKTYIGNIGLNMYHSGTVPLKVGLHRDHVFCPVDGFREVHTQIVGFGKMQQCHEQDVSTLYWEEMMGPGTTHRPMYDAAGNYPWHQYETVTPSIFMAVEFIPEGVTVPGMEGHA